MLPSAFMLPGCSSQATTTTLRLSRSKLSLRTDGQVNDFDGFLVNGSFPSPMIRLTQSRTAELTVENRLATPVSMHWHGLRVANAEDGVGGLTQASIQPRASHRHRLTSHDAGTFWYHPHQNSLQLLAGGMFGPLIVDESIPYAVAREHVWVLSEFFLRQRDGALALDEIYTVGDIAMSAIDYRFALNDGRQAPLELRADESLRLRLIAAGPFGGFDVSATGLDAWMIALDAQPITPVKLTTALPLVPGQRADLWIHGSSVGPKGAISLESHAGLAPPLSVPVSRLGPANLATQRAVPAPLPPNELPALDLPRAHLHTLRFGFASSNVRNAYRALGAAKGAAFEVPRQFWTINGRAIPEQFQQEICGADRPLLTLRHGDSAVWLIENNTDEEHPFHLHGHVFIVLDRDEYVGGKPVWRDTVAVPARGSRRIAFVADNRGRWMIHCHHAGHQAQGLMAFFEVV
jgi:FtsP/CotA-like multicopper oxidase with cupredoxin domain